MMGDPLDWDATYAIAQTLRKKYPDADLTEVSLEMIYRWTLRLSNFIDDPGLANDGILSAIYQEWFEELIHDG
jgi:FeS assembly protein IscX